MKLTSLNALLAAGAALLVAVSPALAADYTLSVNTALATSDPLYKGLESFRDNIATASDGRIEVKLFPNSQLGPDEDVLEQARAGAPVAVVVDGGRLAVFVNEFGVLGAPYLASGYEGIRIRMAIDADCSDDEIDELLDIARGHSPVCTTVCRPVPVTIERARS